MTLRTELEKPQYAEMVANRDYEALEAILSIKNIPVSNVSIRMNELDILDVLGPSAGDTFLSNIESAAVQIPVLNRVVRWLRSEHGLAIGKPAVQATILQLANNGLVNTSSANIIIARGTKLVSIADQLDIGIIGRAILEKTINEMGA